jgi:4-hydroxy-tetrahydrodipicolinate synthase
LKEFGVLVPLVTPCYKNGIIDFSGLKNVCKDMIEAGCDGMFIAGSTGRGPWFSLKDRIRLCESVKEYVGDHVPLYAGCMASGLSDMIENAKAMMAAGADVAVITAPGYFSYNHNEIGHIFLDFANNSPLPVLIYDVPVFSGIKLDLNIFLKLSHHANIIGLKDSSSDMNRFRELVTALENNEDKCLFQGKEHLLAESILIGASGIVVSLLHVDPRLFVSLYRAARSGDRNKALRIQNVIIRVMNLVVGCLDRRPETSTLFHFLNNTLKIRGVCENIIIEHEGECPDWLWDESVKAVDICKSTSTL